MLSCILVYNCICIVLQHKTLAVPYRELGYEEETSPPEWRYENILKKVNKIKSIVRVITNLLQNGHLEFFPWNRGSARSIEIIKN